MTRRSHCRRAVMGLAVLLAAGCGESGPDRKFLEGSVTHKGKPVLLGSIKFNPDRSKGNSGVQGSAEIRDGHYQTNPMMGPGLGPHIALVTGYESGEAGPDAKPLFIDAAIPVEFTAESRTVDLDVPVQGKK